VSEWQEVRLKDIVTFRVGRLDSNAMEEDGIYPFFTCAPKTYKINSYAFDTTAILLAGNNATGIFPIKFYSGKFNCYQRTYVIENINNSVSDLKFMFFSIKIQLDFLRNMSVGATTKFLTKGMLENLKINLPPLPTQQKIAKILSNYDDLIENNLKRIKLLEESARLTYEEWFLRFRIDGKKLEIDPESGLPLGWECKLMKDFGEVVTGKTPSTNNEDYYGGDIPFVKTPSMHGNTYTLETTEYLTSLGANSQQNKFLSKNSLMVSCIGTAGVYSLVASNCQTNQQINSIKFYKEEYIFYIYGFAGHLTNVLDAIGSNGATMTNVNKTKFENIKVPMPSVDLLERFHNTFNPNFESILNIMKQNQLLKEARDILLPRLMTGMIDTNDMDIAV